MKKNKTNYTNKTIDANRYSIVNTNEHKISEEEMKEMGYVFLPYVLSVHTEESSTDYDEFMGEYYLQHKYCPKCGATNHTSTLVAYVLNWDKKDEYKDMNRCECMECGDKHYVHDRVANKFE